MYSRYRLSTRFEQYSNQILLFVPRPRFLQAYKVDLDLFESLVFLSQGRSKPFLQPLFRSDEHADRALESF